MTYTVQLVSPETRQYDSKFGPMIAYKVKFVEAADTVDISQKPETPAPTVGQTMEGHIEETQYGHKFKKDYQAGGPRGGFTPRGSSVPATAAAPTGAPMGVAGKKFSDDPFTMYLAYAKDLLVALVETGGYDKDKYQELLQAALSGGKALHNGRPGAPAPEQAKPEPKQLDTVVEDVFGDQAEMLNALELPWDGQP